MCDWIDSPRFVWPLGAVEQECPVISDAAAWLDRYFAGAKDSAFPWPLRQPGTPLRQLVWSALLTVPYATKATYLDIARSIGRPEAMRAVASAIGENRISIFIPCHRIITSRGAIGGYRGGTDTKKALLLLESSVGHRFTDAT